jgi:hypothetical protein
VPHEERCQCEHVEVDGLKGVYEVPERKGGAQVEVELEP